MARVALRRRAATLGAAALLLAPRAFAQEPVSAPPATPSEAAPEPAPEPVTAPPPPPKDPRFAMVPAYVAGGLAVASLGAGTVLAILAAKDHADFTKQPSDAIANRGEARELAADVLFGAAATLAVATVILYLGESSPRDPAAPTAPSPRVAVTPFVSAGGAGAGAVVRF